MTAGEHSGRGYGHDDEYASPVYREYPALPARPTPGYQAPAASAYPAPSTDIQPAYRPEPTGYNGRTGSHGTGYYGAGNGADGYGGDGYGGDGRGPATYGGGGQRPPGYGRAAANGSGHPSSGYPGSQYPTAGSNGYPAAGNGYPGYPAAGHNGQPGYPAAGHNGQPGYPAAGHNGQPAGRHSAEAGRHHRPEYPDSGYRDTGYRHDPDYRHDAGYGHGAYAGQPYRGAPSGGTGHVYPAYRVVDHPAATGVSATASPAQAYPPPQGARPVGGRARAEGHDVARHRQLGGASGGGPGGRGPDRGGAGRAAVAEAEPEQQGTRRRLPLWQELPLLLVIAFCLAVLIRTFLLQAFFIPSGSMEDTLITGDRVLVNKVIYNFRDPTRGEVVVFRGTDAWAPLATDDGEIGTFAKVARTFGDLVGVSQPGEKDYIKRVVGLPGDVVSCCDEQGRVLVNGSPIDEPYVVRDSPLAEATPDVSDCRSRQFAEVVVEPGHMFVMGDHRARSQDSRCQGQVPIENVIGRAFIIVWPNDRWAGLSATDAFDNVPAAATAAGPPHDVEVVQEVPAPPAGQLGVVLPLLLPLVSTSVLGARGGGGGGAGSTARSRVAGRNAGRRLSG